MGLHRIIDDNRMVLMSTSTLLATTAGTSILIPSLSSAVISAGSASIYITDLILSSGPSQSSLILGIGASATAPTTTAILIQSLFLPANQTVPLQSLSTPIKIAATTNVLVTSVSNTTLSVTALYYLGQ